jgi:fucose 4-O-acetylase-like acetyltransferase
MAAPRDWVGHVSLALFLVLTAFLAGQSFRRAGAYALMPRLKRLLVPWVVWCAFYWLVEYDVSDRARLFVLPSDPWSLLFGPSVHLWFLPFVALASLGVAPLGRWITGPGRARAAAVGLFALGLPLWWVHLGMGLPAPLEQWAFALPLYGAGLILGLGQREVGAVLLAMLGLTLTLLTRVGAETWVWTGGLAVLGFLALWHLPLAAGAAPVAQALGRDAFGIYLMHPFFLLVVYKFLGPDLGWPANAVAAFLMSWAGAALLRRLPYGDRLA